VFSVAPSGTRHNAVSYLKDLPNRTSTGILKKPTVIDRAWETGRSTTFKINNQKIIWEVLMPSRNQRMRALEQLQLAAPISDDASLLKLEEYVAEYVREAKRRDAQQPNELISPVVDAVAHDYFRHVFRKQIKRSHAKAVRRES
jgi:hypothetical protein